MTDVLDHERLKVHALPNLMEQVNKVLPQIGRLAVTSNLDGMFGKLQIRVLQKTLACAILQALSVQSNGRAC